MKKLLIYGLSLLMVGSMNVGSVQAKRVRLNHTSRVMDLGAKTKIRLIGGKARSWSSSKRRVASVKKGVITANDYGTAVIRVKNGKRTYRCYVRVRKPYISPTSVKLSVQGTKTLKLLRNKKKVKWSSSKKSVVSVSKKGKITAKKVGSAYIRAKAGKRTYSRYVKVLAPKINYSKVKLAVGATKQLKMINVYKGAQVSWRSLNPAVATVDGAGKVTAVASGDTPVVATLDGKDYYTTISVGVMSMSKTNLSTNVGKKVQLKINNCALQAGWSSSDPNVLTVDQTGRITALQVGTAVVTAVVNGMNFTCNVTVNAADPDETEEEIDEETLETRDGKDASTANYTDERTTYVDGIVGQTINVKGKIGNNKKHYVTSDKKVAIVSDSGLVMPLKEGDVTITNTASHKSIDISITEPVSVENGVDISRHNGSVDFAKMKAQGIDFAIIRAGNGKTKWRTTYSNGIDLNFKSNMDKATAAGMKYGVYWYVNTSNGTTKRLMTTKEAKEQATVLADYLDANKTSMFQLPLYLDLEQTSALVKSGTTAANRASFIKSICEAYMSVLIPRGYTNIGIYSSTSWYKSNLQNDFFVSQTSSIWQAHYGYSSVTGSSLCGYTSVPTFTYNGVRYYPDLWQTGSDFKVDGVSGYVDMNYRYR